MKKMIFALIEYRSSLPISIFFFYIYMIHYLF